jgi:hypothetical protein
MKAQGDQTQQQSAGGNNGLPSKGHYTVHVSGGMNLIGMRRKKSDVNQHCGGTCKECYAGSLNS